MKHIDTRLAGIPVEHLQVPLLPPHGEKLAGGEVHSRASAAGVPTAALPARSLQQSRVSSSQIRFIFIQQLFKFHI